MPMFSIITTTFNRPRLLRRCVESLLVQQGDFEILIVDDGSRTPAAKVLKDYTKAIRILRQSQQGWGAARLLGGKAAQGEIFVFLDDDCYAPPHWLAAYARIYHEQPEVDGVAGSLRPGKTVNFAGYKQYLSHRAYFNQLNAPLDMEHAGFCRYSFGGNRSFRRDIWLKAQPDMSVWYGDDALIDRRLQEMNARIYYTPDAWVEHHYDLSVPQRIRAAYRYGKSEHLLHDTEMIRPDSDVPVSGEWWYTLTQPLAKLAYLAGRLKYTAT